MTRRNTPATEFPIVSVLLHVPDWRSATEWYARAFDTAVRIRPETDDYGHLDIGGVALEIVNADDKVASGPAGSVVYWFVADLSAEIARLGTLGATLYRGPLDIDGGDRICQVRDPWGNCIGLRQKVPQVITESAPALTENRSR
ncbi:glyoxalase/bleomycin resistance/dioxygenase family protein [Pseudomonas jessenii]|jgi:predicted enzyme related to lactoylglutathione lyase|uniref:Glyoxalase/bleomycin resistance/dioxygenase family protein n=1 Tax=Pseudomonas jessenii TaxID=77298 RepID=A0A2W0EKZ8_PSEJE|nr:VOC family protein [Pseudomonas jessenii]PYY66855.1 glyoxalase/bleomycin resistance/dioxygenase family protein [Pseudomonas jessenii]